MINSTQKKKRKKERKKFKLSALGWQENEKTQAGRKTFMKITSQDYRPKHTKSS
jgi:hypothetical protein